MISKSTAALSPIIARVTRRPFSLVTIAFVFSTLFIALLVLPSSSMSPFRRGWATDLGVIKESSYKSPYLDKKLHFLLPATQSNVDFCKTLLTLTILGYPKPFIVGWGTQDASDGMLGGGSHFAKITNVLEYVNDEKRCKDPAFDDELLFMIDSYDIWFQLPYEVLLSRYEDIVREDNKRTARQMGRAFDREDISSPVVFGGGKRCSPNQLHTLACYATPMSPLPANLRGGNTDNILGRNVWSNFRTRYLNSGYLIGPVGKMRSMLQRAKEKLEKCIDQTNVWWDEGQGQSDNCYHGSDQSIFTEMFAEQHFHRELMRRHHRNVLDGFMDRLIPGRAGSKPPPAEVMGVEIQDQTNPPFTHEERERNHLPGQPFEFGMSIDYWSLLGHQTSNAEWDARYIRHNEPTNPQIGAAGLWDCPAKVRMPTDLPFGGVTDLLEDELTWESIPLYEEICVATVPVMIHHNNVDKSQRGKQWDKPWWHGHSRRLLEARRREGAPLLMEGIGTDTGLNMKWDALCPKDVE